MTHDRTTFTSGETRTVDVAAIERELATLWKSASETGASGGAVTRACVLNLLVLVSGPRERDDAVRTIAELTASHPSRALVLEEEAPAAPGTAAERDALESWISAHCHRPGPSSPQVCCEQITLRATGGARRRLPPTVASLLVPDLPVFLWCPGDARFGDPLFERLAAMTNRVLVDSARFRDGRAGLSALVERVAVPSRTAFHDLNWERLLDLREYLAQFFDPPHLRDYTDALDEIEISYAVPDGGAANPSQALLLAGWLASRLRLRPEGSGWSLTGAPGHRFEAAGVSGGVEFRLLPSIRREAEDGDIRSVTLGAGRAPVPARFHLQVSPDECCFETEVEMEGTGPIPRRIRAIREGVTALVSRALDRRGRDATLEAALQSVAGIAGLR